MEPAALVTYGGTLAALSASPGPLLAALAARSAERDRRGALAMAAGICAGDAVVIAAIALGLGFWLEAHPGALEGFRLGGAALLLWVAWRMWRRAGAAPRAAPITAGVVASLAAGFLVCVGNPPTAMIFLALLPSVVDLARPGPGDMAAVMAVTFAVRPPVFLLVIALAGAAGGRLASPVGASVCARAASAAVALAAGWLLLAAP